MNDISVSRLANFDKVPEGVNGNVSRTTTDDAQTACTLQESAGTRYPGSASDLRLGVTIGIGLEFGRMGNFHAGEYVTVIKSAKPTPRAPSSRRLRFVFRP